MGISISFKSKYSIIFIPRMTEDTEKLRLMLVLGGSNVRGLLYDLGWQQQEQQQQQQQSSTAAPDRKDSLFWGQNSNNDFESAVATLNAYFARVAQSQGSCGQRRMRYALLVGQQGRPLAQEEPQSWHNRLTTLVKRGFKPGFSFLSHNETEEDWASIEKELDEIVVLVMARFCGHSWMKEKILSKSEKQFYFISYV